MLHRIVSILRPALVLLAIFLIISFAAIGLRAVRTLQTLTAVEAALSSTSARIAEMDLKSEKFEIKTRADDYIRIRQDSWWVVVAAKP